MCGKRAWGRLHLAVVVSEHRLAGLRGFLEVVVRDRGEQVVDDMCANVMVDVVEDAIVPVQGGEATSQVAPLLSSA